MEFCWSGFQKLNLIHHASIHPIHFGELSFSLLGTWLTSCFHLPSVRELRQVCLNCAGFDDCLFYWPKFQQPSTTHKHLSGARYLYPAKFETPGIPKLSNLNLRIKMLGLCFRVYVRRSQGPGTDPAKDSMPRECRRGQGLPSDLPKDSLCLHLVVIDWLYVRRSQGLWDDPAQDSMPRACRRELDALKYPILSVLRKGTDCLQTQWVMCMGLPHM